MIFTVLLQVVIFFTLIAASQVSLWPPPLTSEFGSGRVDGLERIQVFFPPSSLSTVPEERRFQKLLLQGMVRNFFKQHHVQSSSKFNFTSCRPAVSYLTLCLSIPSLTSVSSFSTESPFSLTSFLPSLLPHNAIPFGDNEAYRMRARSSATPTIFIEGSSVWGILRALQSVSQLFILPQPPSSPHFSSSSHTSHSRSPSFSLHGLPFQVSDRPSLAHRSVLVDLPRNYYPLDVLHRRVDFVAACKLNVLHLRLTDDQGFMLDIPSFPSLAKPPALAGPNARVYSISQMKSLVRYAHTRGVRVVPELDMPTHAGSWALYPAEALADDIVLACPLFACSSAWSLMLDPFKNRTYEVIDAVLRVVNEVFPDPFVHLGGDELVYRCIKEARVSKRDYLSTFENRLFNLSRAVMLGKKIIRWQELVSEYFLPWDAMAVWTGAFVPQYPPQVRSMPFILSNGWYIDYAKHCLTAQQCYEANRYLTGDLHRWLGVEISLWEMSPQRAMESDIHSQIVGFSGAAWRIVDRPPYEPAHAEAFCRFLEQARLVDPRFQCHLHSEINTHAYHNDWRMEFMQREVERDTLICHRYQPDAQCTTPNCKRGLFN